MVIRPLTAGYSMGELGRPVNAKGENGGPALFFSKAKDVVSLGMESERGAGLYAGKPWFKMMGAVELMSEDCSATFRADGVL